MDCVKDEDEAPNPMVLINPEIIAASDETNVYEEGCLSIPDQFAEVTAKTGASALDGFEWRRTNPGI